MALRSHMFLLWLLLSCLPVALPIALPNKEQDYAPQGPTARTRGATFIGNADGKYGVDIWLGIRYAKPPTGSLRLQPPQGVEVEGVVNAKEFSSQCFQIGSNVSQSEDCLTLNIYRPSTASLPGHSKHERPKLLPVMFWIHGGGFNDGSSAIYHPESLVNRSAELGSPVIVITINYRLSFFGFSAGKEAIANNALNLGLLDQRLALKWVQGNVAAFGGDPEKVTLFGQSAGATSIGLQITAYDGQCDDLFRAAILESGSPADTAPTPPPAWPAYQKAWDSVIAGIGCTNSSNVFSCVQNVPESALFPVIRAVGTTQAPLPSSTFPWQPVVDGHFVSDFPSKLVAAGKFAKVPIIMGFTTDELTYVIPTNLNISNDTLLAELAAFVMPFVPISTIEEILVLDPLSAFPNTYGLGGIEWKRATAMASDIFERCPGRSFIRNVTEYTSAWEYRFNAIIPAQLAEAPWEGIVHAAEIPYVFGPSITVYLNETIDIALSRTVQQGWIAFASYLDPNALGNLSPGLAWPRYDKGTEQVLVFQKTDGSAGPVGQGIHTEKDQNDRPTCDFIIAEDAQFVR